MEIREQTAQERQRDPRGASMTIAIDGPSGAGKSTVARLVARRLGLQYIDTGAMYRAVALKALTQGIDLEDAAALARVADTAGIELVSSAAGQETWLDGRDVSRDIRSREVGAVVAKVAAVPGVRSALVGRQRALAARGGVVMEGRDIGTNVLPGAPYKFYITADPAARVKRRAREYRAGSESERGGLAREMAERDRLDERRARDPLRAAPDAVVVDSTSLSVEEVADVIRTTVTGRG